MTMRGGFLHNQVMAAGLEKWFLDREAEVRREHPVKLGDGQGAIDLFIRYRHLLIACEVEFTLSRVPNDVAKAEASGADVGLIITPSGNLARAAWRLLRRRWVTNGASSTRIHVFAFGIAMQRLEELFSFPDSHDSLPVTNQKTLPCPVLIHPKGD